MIFALEELVAGNDIVSEEDLKPLPEPVQNYLRYVGVVGKPKVNTVRMVFEGEMRDREKGWFKFTNDFSLPTYGEAVWHYPAGEFVYGKLYLKSLEYNVSELE